MSALLIAQKIAQVLLGFIATVLLPQVLDILRSAKTRALLATFAEVMQLAGVAAARAAAAKLVEAKHPGSDGGINVTAKEREAIVDAAVAAVIGVLEGQRVLDKIIKILFPGSTPADGRAALEAQIRHKVSNEI